MEQHFGIIPSEGINPETEIGWFVDNSGKKNTLFDTEKYGKKGLKNQSLRSSDVRNYYQIGWSIIWAGVCINLLWVSRKKKLENRGREVVRGKVNYITWPLQKQFTSEEEKT